MSHEKQNHSTHVCSAPSRYRTRYRATTAGTSILQRVIDTYIQNNLDLQAARFKLERTKADQIAARLRPNPGITVTAENLPVSGPTPFRRLIRSRSDVYGNHRTGRQAGASRKGGQCNGVRGRSAVRRHDAPRTGRREAPVLSRRCSRGYNVEVATESRQTFDQLLQFNVTRFQEGAIPELDLIKVRLERVKFDSAVKQAELGFRQATIRLLEKLGVSFPRPAGRR